MEKSVDFKAWRLGLGLTQDAASRILGLQLRTVQKYEAREINISGPVLRLMTAVQQCGEFAPWPSREGLNDLGLLRDREQP